MRRPLVIGNWKMHGSRSFNREWVAEFNSLALAKGGVDIVVAPPAPYLDGLVQALSALPVSVAAQDLCDVADAGAYTGQVSASMLADLGCDYVIVGHSERRAYQFETDTLVAKKVLAALSVDICPVVCVGENLEEREAGQALSVIQRQVSAVLDAVGPEMIGRIVIAYEPVWAIGTGKTASPVQAQEVHSFIRGLLSAEAADKVRILYGGSVKGSNAQSLFAQSDIDGALVGGASLDAKEFKCICDSASPDGLI